VVDAPAASTPTAFVLARDLTRALSSLPCGVGVRWRSARGGRRGATPSWGRIPDSVRALSACATSSESAAERKRRCGDRPDRWSNPQVGFDSPRAAWWMKGRSGLAHRLVASDDPYPRSRCGERRICRGAAASPLRAFEGLTVPAAVAAVPPVPATLATPAVPADIDVDDVHAPNAPSTRNGPSAIPTMSSLERPSHRLSPVLTPLLLSPPLLPCHDRPGYHPRLHPATPAIAHTLNPHSPTLRAPVHPGKARRPQGSPGTWRMGGRR
jgi:hypothetical protein